VNELNNKFYFAKNDAKIPESSYEMRDINEFLIRVILRKHLLETIDVVCSGNNNNNNNNNDTDDDNGESGEPDYAPHYNTR